MAAVEERTYFWTGYLVIAIVVFIPLLMFMNKSADADSFKEKIISNELALISDFVMGSDGEILVEYNINQEKSYKIGFNEKCLFVVSLTGTSLESGSKTYCADNLLLNKRYLDAGEYVRIILDKKEDRLVITGGISE